MDRPIALSHAGSLAAEAVLEKLSESGVKPDSLVLLDHESQAGKRVAYGGTHLVLADQLQADLSDCALLLLLQDDPHLESIAVQQGCLVAGHASDDDETALFLAPGIDEPAISYSASRLRLVGAEAACVLPALTARCSGCRRLTGTQYWRSWIATSRCLTDRQRSNGPSGSSG